MIDTEEPLFELDPSIWKWLPDSVNYIAMDESGEWFAYSLEPEIGDISWASTHAFECENLYMYKMPEVDRKYWRETLVSRPELKYPHLPEESQR